MSDVYDVYHDECKEGGYWHGFFFVPRSARQLLLDLLKLARTISGYPHEVHYIKLGSRIKPHYETAIITQAWTSIGVAALQQQNDEKAGELERLRALHAGASEGLRAESALRGEDSFVQEPQEHAYRCLRLLRPRRAIVGQRLGRPV